MSDALELVSGGSEVTATVYEELLRSVRARHIQTPLDRALTLDHRMSQQEAWNLLAKRQFDYAPVAEGRRILGRVALTALNRAASTPVEAAFEPLADLMLTSADAPIRELMMAMTNSAFIFVVETSSISGLVTPSDLNKQAARMYFYVLTSDFEVWISDLIRKEYSNQEAALALLPPDRHSAVTKLFKKAQEANREADPIAYATLRDLVMIAGHGFVSEGKVMGMAEDEWGALTNKILELRNTISHPVRPLIGNGRALHELLELEASLLALLESPPTSQGHGA